MLDRILDVSASIRFARCDDADLENSSNKSAQVFNPSNILHSGHNCRHAKWTFSLCAKERGNGVRGAAVLSP